VLALAAHGERPEVGGVGSAHLSMKPVSTRLRGQCGPKEQGVRCSHRVFNLFVNAGYACSGFMAFRWPGVFGSIR